MLTKVRRFLNNRSPSWLKQEIHLFPKKIREEDIEIVKPLQTVANKPHWKRINKVYEALDNATNKGITKYTDLIEYVKKETGTGCSRKLIAKWKREREG
jgi:hypothetical protein